MSTNKQRIRNLLEEFFMDFSDYDTFDYDFTDKSFFVEVLKAVNTPNHKNQKDLVSFDKSSLFCVIKGKTCFHANPKNNKEIGYVNCSGEYCNEQIFVIEDI